MSSVIYTKSLTDISKSIEGSVVIVDKNIYNKYNILFFDCETIVIEATEENKTLETVNYIYNKFLSLGVDRNSRVFGIGGGIITDITGYVCSTYMRGCNFYFVPTTLLGCVDAAIGGKNGVNYNGYKNMIGTINEPKEILICTEFLKTLSSEEAKNGFGEIVKYALLMDDKKLLTNDLETLISKCVKYKQYIVGEDKYEKHTRKLLNLGHTIGHGVEKYFKYKYPHGQAVLIGIYYMLKYSLKFKYISKSTYNTWLKIVLNNFDYEMPKLDVECLNHIKCDKKHNGNTIDVVVIKEHGCEITNVNIDNFVKDICDII